jgi:hypothetical protein
LFNFFICVNILKKKKYLENQKFLPKSNPLMWGDIMGKNTIVCVGYSRLPEGMAAKNLYGTMGIGFEIEIGTNIIKNTSSTFVTNMCSDFLNNIFVNHCLDDGIEDPINEFEKRYFGLGKKAVIAAIRDAYNQFQIYKATYEQEKEIIVR